MFSTRTSDTHTSVRERNSKLFTRHPYGMVEYIQRRRPRHSTKVWLNLPPFALFCDLHWRKRSIEHPLRDLHHDPSEVPCAIQWLPANKFGLSIAGVSDPGWNRCSVFRDRRYGPNKGYLGSFGCSSPTGMEDRVGVG